MRSRSRVCRSRSTPTRGRGCWRTARSSCEGFEELAAGAALVKVGEDDAELLYGEPLDALRDRLVGARRRRGARDAGCRRGDARGGRHRRHAPDLDAARPHRRHDGRGRRRLRRDGRGARARGRRRPRMRGARCCSRRWMSRPRRAASRARCCARRRRSRASTSTTSAPDRIDFEHRVTQGRIVDRASGRLEKLGGCALGELPKRPKGSDCKSAVLDFGGSNPSLATKRRKRPRGGAFAFADDGCGFGSCERVSATRRGSWPILTLRTAVPEPWCGRRPVP